MSAIEGQHKARAGLAVSETRPAGRARLLSAPPGRRIETEAAPIRYVAELVGADTDSVRAIRCLIALMVLCGDPLAIALTAAASARRSEARGDEQSEVETVHSM